MSNKLDLELPFSIPMPERSPREVFDETVSVDPDSAHKIEVGIPTRDGTELAADIFLPPASQRPAPAVVIGTPYDKSSPFEQGQPWQEAGYVGIVYDVRGRGKSEGIWHPHVYEPQDAYDLVEWVAAQEWCNGDVGVNGISYLGGMVWKTLSERPPSVKAAISTSPEGRWQEECPYMYGCFWLYYDGWYAMTRRRIFDHGLDVGAMVEMLPVEKAGEVLNPAGPGWPETMEHETLDEVWRSRRWDGEYDYDVPCLHVGAWHDRDAPTGIYHHYEEMMSTSPARDKQWLLVGPWSHVGSRYPEDSYRGVPYPGAAIDMTALHIRFFDRYLKGIDNGFDDEPRVQLYDSGAKRWQAREKWQGNTSDRRFYIGADGALTDAAGEAGEDSYTYDPMNAAGIRFDPNAAWETPLELNDLGSQDGVVTWTTEPLAADLTVHGWGELELWAATDGDETEWHAWVADVDPDGAAIKVTWGCLRASYGDDASNPQPVTPGEVKRYSVELIPAFHTFKVGHRLRLLLASSDYPFFARNMNRFGKLVKQDDPRIATNTVHHGGAYPSCLRLLEEH